MSFAKDLNKFANKVKRQNQQIFKKSVAAVDKSIRVGSALTGAPGQPVDTGFLRNSFETTVISKSEMQVATACEYAGFIEDGQNSRGAFTLRSKVGGFHSIKLTRAGWQNIVDHVTEEVLNR